MISDLYVLEWSQRANVLHVQKMQDTLSFNRRLYENNRSTTNDYRIIHVGTKDECLNAANAVRNTIKSRE